MKKYLKPFLRLCLEKQMTIHIPMMDINCKLKVKIGILQENTVLKIGILQFLLSKTFVFQ